MGKKAKRKPHKGSVQRPKKPLQSALSRAEKIEGNELGQSEKFCKHLDKGIHLGELESQMEKSSVLQCQGCLRGVSGKKNKKGKVKQVKKKGGFKDTNKGVDFTKGKILVCLACGHMGCGGDENGPSPSGHAWQHWLQAHHPNAVQCNDNDNGNGSLVLWCFLCKGSVQHNSVVEGGEGCQSLQLQALKLVEEKLINQYVNETVVASRGKDDVVGDSEKDDFQNMAETNDVRVRSTRHIVRGLRNLGNTCFFNSVVQNLLALDVLRDHFMNSGQYVEGPITLALRKLYLETTSEEIGQGDGFGPKMGMNVNGTINPRALFDAVCDSSSQFRGYQQQDSHELWQFLLNSLRAEESNVRKSRGNTSSAFLDANGGDSEAFEGNRRENPNNVTNTSDRVTLLEHVFEGQLCSTIFCCKCGHSSVTYESFYDLQLPIPREKTGKKALLTLSKDSSLPKVKLKKNAITSKHRQNAGKWSSGTGDVQSQGNADLPSPEISLPGAQARDPAIEEIAENMSVMQETTESNRLGTQGDCGWNVYAPQEDNGWTGYVPQEDTVWMDYLVSGTESDDILHENLLDTSENGQQVDSNYVGNINTEWNFTLTDSSETEPPLPVLGDSEILLLPYKEVDPIVGEQLQSKGDYVDLPQDDIKDALGNHLDVDVSSIDAETFDGFGQLFEEEEETAPAQKNEEGECDSFLYGENVNDFLDIESFATISEAKEEEMEANVIPMSLDGCLVDFTKLETLTEENAYQCEKCFATVVASSDKQENIAAKADKGMRSKNTLAVGSLCTASDASSTCGKEDDVETLGKSNLLSEVRDIELQNLNSARSCGAPAMEAENLEICSSGKRCSGNGESKICNDQGLNEADIGIYQEMHQMETLVAGCVAVNMSDDIILNDSSGELASCSYTDICSNENLSGNFGSEFREETDVVTEAEWSPSASLSSKGKESDANSKGYALRPPKQLSTGKRYVLDKRKSKMTQFNPNVVKHEATKRYFISKAPSVLVIHLKRFSQDLRGRLSKLGGHVTFQERLDLRPFLDPRCSDKDNCIYHLNGVVEHLGTMRSGHYVAYVRCHQDENYNHVKGDDHPDRSPWYYVSDSDVSRISFSKVLQCEAYLLFYEKCTSC